MRAPPLAAGLAGLAPRYDGLLVDLWGCLHDGVEPHAAAVEALSRFRAGGGRVVLLSNAPRGAAAVARQLRRIGVPDEAWDAIITAGEAVRLAFAERQPAYAALGRRFHAIGTAGAAALLNGLSRRPAALDEADFVLCCGIRRPGETLDEVVPELARARARGLPLVCANPDRFVLRGGVRELCAGTLAAAYAARGGRVIEEGKPHPAIYRRALALLEGVAPARVLAIGDGIETDIAGADRTGLASLWITGGLPAHDWGIAPQAPPPQDRLEQACAAHGVMPAAVMPMLAW